MRIVRFADVDATAWANGLGETREIASARQDDTLLWRISVATISGPSAFSTLPGLDRRLMNLGDVPLRLVRGEAATVTLAPLEILAFAGEEAVRAEAGNGYDLNLMTARGRCSGDLRLVTVDGDATLIAPTAGGTVATLALDEGLGVAQAAGITPLAPLDCALAAPTRSLTVTGRGRVAVLEIHPAP